jgi:hypothetical protein
MLENINSKDLISSITIIVSVFIAIFGWYYNSKQNRKHEIFKKSLDARIKLLEDYLLFFQKATETKSLDGFNEIQVRFYIYGNKDEIELVKKISSEIEKNKQVTEEIYKTFIKLNNLTRDRLREEIGLEKVDI